MFVRLLPPKPKWSIVLYWSSFQLHFFLKSAEGYCCITRRCHFSLHLKPYFVPRWYCKMNCIQAEASQAQLLHLTAAYKHSTPNPWSSSFASSYSIRLKLARCFGECSFSKPINLYCELYSFFSVLNKATKKDKEIRNSLLLNSQIRIKKKFRIYLRLWVISNRAWIPVWICLSSRICYQV